ncbi:MAG: fibronectin type III domain-containing protein [Bacteroidia bacterium]|nr:fibronectin type III domain-containing protein [Bacteroidia bacterium]
MKQPHWGDEHTDTADKSAWIGQQIEDSNDNHGRVIKYGTIILIILLLILIPLIAMQILNKNNSNINTNEELPIISNVSIKELGNSSFEVTWATDKDSSSQIGYCRTNSKNACALTSLDSNLIKSHKVIVSGLVGNAKYIFTVLSTDRYGNIAIYEIPEPVIPK